MSLEPHHYFQDESILDLVLIKNYEEYSHGRGRHFHDSDQKSKIDAEIKIEKFERNEESSIKLEKSSIKRKSYQKWEDSEKKKYWFGMIDMVKGNPLVKHSWENWKIDKCFKKMEANFQGTKNHSQIKSFDQRMKDQFLTQKGIDLEKAICKALREFDLSEEEAAQLAEFENLRSSETFDLGEDEKKTIELLEKDILKLEEENKQLEVLLKFFPGLEVLI